MEPGDTETALLQEKLELLGNLDPNRSTVENYGPRGRTFSNDDLELQAIPGRVADFHTPKDKGIYIYPVETKDDELLVVSFWVPKVDKYSRNARLSAVISFKDGKTPKALGLAKRDPRFVLSAVMTANNRQPVSIYDGTLAQIDLGENVCMMPKVELTENSNTYRSKLESTPPMKSTAFPPGYKPW